ncbi:hypothetical protein HJG60_009561 [Phyllostomus discolor]|uniref:Secreted protein n=1 Tax=Phyllostomus discolor TaxID=89673 RepID=A0A833Y858_9CHIR|nr:hypothetical protein HJG60_009561 [Phyllostomus discolor]
MLRCGSNYWGSLLLLLRPDLTGLSWCPRTPCKVLTFFSVTRPAHSLPSRFPQHVARTSSPLTHSRCSLVRASADVQAALWVQCLRGASSSGATPTPYLCLTVLIIAPCMALKNTVVSFTHVLSNTY